MDLLSRKASRLEAAMKETLADLSLGDEGLMKHELVRSSMQDDGSYVVILSDCNEPVSWALVQPAAVWGGDLPRVMMFTDEMNRCRGFGRRVMNEVLEKERYVVVSSWDSHGESFYSRFEEVEDRRFDAGVLAPSNSKYFTESCSFELAELQ